MIQLFGKNLEPVQKKSENIIYGYSESDSEEQDTDSEVKSTTCNTIPHTSSKTNCPTIDLTNVEMSECDINEKSPSQKTIDMTNMDMASSENEEITSNNG